MQNFIASEVGVFLICTPPIEQSDWLECYNHGTNICVCGIVLSLGKYHDIAL